LQPHLWQDFCQCSICPHPIIDLKSVTRFFSNVPNLPNLVGKPQKPLIHNLFCKNQANLTPENLSTNYLVSQLFSQCLWVTVRRKKYGLVVFGDCDWNFARSGSCATWLLPSPSQINHRKPNRRSPERLFLASSSSSPSIPEPIATPPEPQFVHFLPPRLDLAPWRDERALFFFLPMGSCNQDPGVSLRTTGWLQKPVDSLMQIPDKIQNSLKVGCFLIR
jgi:hypothetical protein